MLPHYRGKRLTIVRSHQRKKAHKTHNFVLVARAATRETVEMTRRMSDAGADAVLIITPAFYKNAMNNEALYKHYISVTIQLTHIIIIIIIIFTIRYTIDDLHWKTDRQAASLI